MSPQHGELAMTALRLADDGSPLRGREIVAGVYVLRLNADEAVELNDLGPSETGGKSTAHRLHQADRRHASLHVGLSDCR